MARTIVIGVLSLGLVVLVVGCGAQGGRSEPAGAVSPFDDANTADGSAATDEAPNPETNGGTAEQAAGAGAGFTPQPESGVAALRRFETEAEFLDYMTGQITLAEAAANAGDAPTGGDSFLGDFLPDGFEAPVAEALPDFDLGTFPSGGGGGGFVDGADVSSGTEAPAALPPNATGGFSGTTIQEAGVDEADVVKTDGTYLYILSDGLLRIVQAVPADALAERSQFALEGYGQDMYLVDNRVVAVTTVSNDVYTFVDAVPEFLEEIGVDPEDLDDIGDFDVIGDVVGALGGGALPPDAFRPPGVQVTVIDVTDPAAPQLISATRFDGTLADTRMVDGVLRLVLAGQPGGFGGVGGPFAPMGMRVERQPMDGAGATPDTADMMPRFETKLPDGSTQDGVIVSWEQLYRPADPDGYGMSVLVSLDVRAPESFHAVGIVADPGLVYSSIDALYLTDTSYSLAAATPRTTTDLYKFTYGADGPVPAAAGTVDGRILDQYSLSEYDGYLRVATTADAPDAPFGTTNHVFVLAEQAGALEVVGSVADLAPGESIYAARFVEDHGYVVTFRQIDPLFAIDLSDPLNPTVAGEVKVPGYSTFIVPISGNRVVTIGEHYSDEGFYIGGVKLSIFDVTDFANPVLAASEVIGGEDAYAYSEAQYNPKALNVFSSPEHGELLALPVEIESYDEQTAVDDDAIVITTTQTRFNGVYVYRITEAGFELAGRVSTLSVEDPYAYANFGRGVFINDDVYAVTDRTVVAAPLADLNTPLSRVDFAYPELDYPSFEGDVPPDVDFDFGVIPGFGGGTGF